jgi:hypothetical protein
MNLPSSMLFKLIECDETPLLDILKCLKNTEYSRSTGEGFSIDEIEDHAIYANFIYQSPSFVSKFDDEYFEIKKEKIISKVIVPFSINTSYNLLTIYSNSSSSYRLITELGKVLKLKIAINDVRFTPKLLISKFEEAKIPFEITSLKIKNFNVNDKFSGTFWIKVFDQRTAEELIENYPGDISFFTASTEIYNQNRNLGFYESGRLRVYNGFDDIFDISKILINILFFEGD